MVEAGQFQGHVAGGVQVELKFGEPLGFHLGGGLGAGGDQFPGAAVALGPVGRHLLEVGRPEEFPPPLPVPAEQVAARHDERERPPDEVGPTVRPQEVRPQAGQHEEGQADQTDHGEDAPAAHGIRKKEKGVGESHFFRFTPLLVSWLLPGMGQRSRPLSPRTV